MHVKMLAAMLMFLLAAPVFGANTSLSQYLSTYMPNAAISSYSLHNVSIGTSSYVIMQHGTSFIVVNETNGYSMMMNATQIYAVLKPYVLSAYTPGAAVLEALNASMNAYVSQAAPPLNDCLTETGLNQYTCNATNACFSCQTVPICSHWLPYYGGPTGVMGLGIMNFSGQYRNLTSNYTAFYSAVKSTDASPYQSIAAMKKALSNIARISVVLPQNPIFPLPQNFTASSMASCSSYAMPSQEPWYCVDIGMCEYTTFNSTLLSSMQNTVQQLSMLPLSNSSIMQLSVNASDLAKAYVQPVLNAKATAAFNAFLNATLPKYNSSLDSAKALLSRVSNASLSASVSELEGTFAAIMKQGINQSIALANTEILDAISNTTALYSKLNALYAPLNSTAYSTSVAAVRYQLDYRSVPPLLAKLSAEQQGISLELMQGIGSASLQGMLANESAISKGISSFSGTPFTLASFVKSVDGGAVSAMLYSPAGPVASKIASAPAYAALISFIIGIIVLLLAYSLVYSRLKRKRKIKVSRRVKRSWSILFLVLFVLVIIYAYATYAYAQGANSFLPVSMFIGRLQGSTQAVIMVNDSGSLNAAQLLCAATLQKELKSSNKSVAIFAVENYSCVTANATLSGVQCSNKFLASGVPIIYMGSGTGSSIYYKGMYGNMLYAQGNATYGSSCELASLLK
ncbi:MAG: hypothetical protein QXW10_03220 [Candidatus Micrarchaeaceae archaeon]